MFPASFMPPELRFILERSQRLMGAGQGDSSGDDGTSSDSSDDEGGIVGSGVSGIVAKARQGRLRLLYLTSLKHLCLNVVIKNHQKLADLEEQKPIFQKMGVKHGNVLDLVLQELWSEKNMLDFFESRHCAFKCSFEFAQMLLHTNLEEFNLGILQKEGDVSKMWPALVEKCPNLRKIFWEDSPSSIPLPIHQLLQFKKLNTIIMPSLRCDDLIVEKLAKGLPDLRVLGVTFDRLSAKGLVHLFKLKQLESLNYHVECGSKAKKAKLEDYKTTLFIKCLENLPNLMELNSEDMTRNLSAFYKKHKSPKLTLKVAKLYLEKTIGMPPTHLPLVKEVLIEGPLSCAKDLAQFSQLEKLEMSIVTSDQALQIMKKLGPQLKHLKISNQYMEDWGDCGISSADVVFDFYEIFSMCPNLEKFHFENTQFCENPCLGVTAKNFKHLKSLEITMYDSMGYQMPMPILEHILRAENLENLNLYWTRCLPKALFNVLNENNKKHFQKLQTLSLDRIWVKNYKGYTNSLKRLISRAPRLREMAIGCTEKGVNEFKSSGLKQICQQIPGLDFSADYDGGICF